MKGGVNIFQTKSFLPLSQSFMDYGIHTYLSQGDTTTYQGPFITTVKNGHQQRLDMMYVDM